jgi:hypothetical protein
MKHNRRYYYLEKLAAPPKPLTPRQEAEAREERALTDRRLKEFMSQRQQYERRQNLSKLWDSMVRSNPELKGRDDLKAQYVDSYMSNQEQMPDSEVQKQLQASNDSWDKGRVEHAYLPGDWRESETSRLMQLAGASKMNPTTGEMEDVPLGYDMYGRPVTNFFEQMGQYAMRPLDTITQIATTAPKVIKKTLNQANDAWARDQDRLEFNRKVESGEIPRPENYDPNTSYLDDPEAQTYRNEILKDRADDYMESQEDARAFSKARDMRLDAEKTNRPTETKRQTYEYFADPNRTMYQKYVVPVAERLGSNSVEMAKVTGLANLEKYEKKHPWLKNARKLTGPALKTFLSVAAVAQPELSPLIPSIIGAIEYADANLSMAQAIGKGGASQQKEIDKNKNLEFGEYEGDPSSASGAAFLDVLSQIPGVKLKDGKLEIVNADKVISGAELKGVNPLNPLGDVSKNLAKETGNLAQNTLTNEATSATAKKMINEGAKGATSTLIAGTGNPLSPILKPVATTSKVVKPPAKKDPSQMSPQEIYMARLEQLENIRQERLAKNQPTNQPQQEVDSTTTAPTYDSTYFQEQLGTGAQEQPIYDVSNTQQQPQKGKTQIQSQVPAVNPPPRPVQQQAINPPPRPVQQPVQQQAVNPQQPTQPQTAKVKVTKPSQGIQVASVTPPTQGYKIK